MSEITVADLERAQRVLDAIVFSAVRGILTVVVMRRDPVNAPGKLVFALGALYDDPARGQVFESLALIPPHGAMDNAVPLEIETPPAENDPPHGKPH